MIKSFNDSIPSRHGTFIVRARDEVLELHADLAGGEAGVVDLQRVHAARADALADDDLAVGVKAAVVARTAESLAVAGHVDVATGVRADDVPRGHDVLAIPLLRPLQKDRADGHVRRLRPGIDLIG